MSHRVVDRATILILDIGGNVEKTFFESARECLSKIIEQKILSLEKNYVGIMLFGSEKTKNAMAKNSGGFRNIEVLAELQKPSWQMLRDLPVKTSNFEGDWFEALLVAADLVKVRFKEEVSFENIKFILMTNFKSPSDFNKNTVKMVLDGFRVENFEVNVFGLDLINMADKSNDMFLAGAFVRATGGVSVTFEYCMKYLVYHHKKAVRSTPWNVDLYFTPDVKIPVSCYIKLKDEPVVKKWLTAIKDPVTNTASTTEGIIKNKVHVNVENQNIVKSDELIKGYYYGQQLIPLSDYDKSMLYKSGEKSLKVYGFTSADQITWQHLNGDNLLYVLGRKFEDKAQQAIKCLALCLQEQNLIGIVRRVFNRDTAPKLFALMPVVDSELGLRLSMVGICYKEDIKNMAFPPTNLKKYQCSKQQVDAFKGLIKAMDLMKAYGEEVNDDTEAFPIAETVSPTIQYVLDCIAFRAMNPGKPLPEPREDLLKLFKIPPLVEDRSKEQLENLKKMFVLKKVEVKHRNKHTSLLSNDEQNESTDTTSIDVEMTEITKVDIKGLAMTNEVRNIGTIDPINDYNTLMKNGKSLEDLSPLMTEAIESLFYVNVDGTFSKALECIQFFRKQCVDSKPSYYNDWLQSFKMELLERKKNDILEFVISQKLNFILKSENASSKFDTAEEGDSQLYENDTIPTLTDMTVGSQVKTFFDDM